MSLEDAQTRDALGEGEEEQIKEVDHELGEGVIPLYSARVCG